MIVTISREFGAGAVEIAAIVAERCGLRLLMDDLPQMVNDRLGLEREESLSDEDAVPSFFDRLLGQLPGAMLDIAAMPAYDDLDTYSLLLPKVEHSIRDIANTLDAIIIGRAAAQVLGIRWDVIRVFLYAPREWRAARLVAHFGYSEEEAYMHIARIDTARMGYHLEYYGVVWGDARQYDFSIDTSRMAVTDVAEMLISVVATRYQRQ
jgi:cytidylate kinase